MCRLLAFSFRENTSKQDRVNLISSFRELSKIGMVPEGIEKGHTDGWGLSSYIGGTDSFTTYKSILPADSDIEFSISDFVKENISQSGLVHLRKKTVGETSIPNTHPFVEGIYSFIHNGTVEKGNGPYEELASKCQSVTDSERLFKKFLEIREEKDTLSSYLEMLTTTKEKYPNFSAMNTMLCDGRNIYISRVMNENYPQYKTLGLENYYTLFVGKSNEGDFVVSSEKINYKDVDYSLIENNTVLVLDLETRMQKTVSI